MDAFTAASPTYRNAARLGSRPLPLSAGEVAEMRRPNAWTRMVKPLIGLLVFTALIWSGAATLASRGLW